MAVFSKNTLNRFIHALTSQGAATEFFNTYNVTTKGTAEASKALVLDSSKNINFAGTGGVVRTGYIEQLGRAGTAKAGTTAGWVVNAGNNLGTIATIPQSQTASTLVVAVPNLHVGDTITGFSVYSSINSSGGAVTLDANLRKLTIAAGATGTDASVGSITQVAVSAATASSASKTGLTEVVTAGVSYYLLITATTAASTTIELSQIEISVTTS